MTSEVSGVAAKLDSKKSRSVIRLIPSRKRKLYISS